MKVLIPDGDSFFAVIAMWCLADAGSDQFYIISKDRYPAAKYSRYCAGNRTYSPNNGEAWLETICRAAEEWKADVLLPIKIEAVELALRNSELIKKYVSLPPLPSLSGFIKLHDKWQFYRFCLEHDLPAPATALIQKDRCDKNLVLAEELSGFPFPAVLKPLRESGGEGIVLVESLQALQAFLDGASKKSFGDFLIQEFVEGTDLSVGVFCEKGEIIAHIIQLSLLSAGKKFGQQQAMKFIENEEVLMLASRVVAAAKYTGVAYIDMIQAGSTGKMMLTEVNTRLGAGMIGALRAGVNFPLLMCAGALGLPYPLINYRETRYIYPKAYLRHKIQQFWKKESSPNLHMSESGIEYHIADPMPLLFEMARSLTRRNSEPRCCGQRRN